MYPTKMSCRRLLNRIMRRCTDEGSMFGGDDLKKYCQNRMNKRRIDILEEMGALLCIYYDERSELLAVYPTQKAAFVEFTMGATVREKAISFLLGILTGICGALVVQHLVPWLISLL